jgi:hypothetical protein
MNRKAGEKKGRHGLAKVRKKAAVSAKKANRGSPFISSAVHSPQ